MDVFLDIGMTLLGGPQPSPPHSIIDLFPLDQGRRQQIKDIIFCEDHRRPATLLASLAKLTGGAWPQSTESKIEEIWQWQENDVYAMPGAADLLQTLAGSTHRLHIISNIWHPFFLAFQRVFAPYLPAFATFTLSYREGLVKPDPRLFERALVKAAARPQSSVVVGDSLDKDILPARAVGMKCVWLTGNADAPFTEPPAWAITSGQGPAWYRVTALSEVVGILEVFAHG